MWISPPPASRLERSRGWIVQKALLDWLAREDIRRRMTLEALADVDAGRVADHETVRAWAEKLGRPKTKKSYVNLHWTSKAHDDLARLYAFLAKSSTTAAANAVRALVAAPEKLLSQPRIGEPLEEFEPREVRR